MGPTEREDELLITLASRHESTLEHKQARLNLILQELGVVTEQLRELTRYQEDLLGRKYQLECDIYRLDNGRE